MEIFRHCTQADAVNKPVGQELHHTKRRENEHLYIAVAQLSRDAISIYVTVMCIGKTLSCPRKISEGPVTIKLNDI